MHLHPVIRIVSLLVLALGLAAGGGYRLALGAALVAAGQGLASAARLGPLWRTLWRLRFLWLTLCVVYFWMTPGAPLVAQWGPWSPTVAGLKEGLLRVGALVVIAAGAHLLVQTTPREQLLLGIHWLAAPLGRMGLSRERLALRLVLVLDTVPKIQPLAHLRASNRGGRIGTIGSRLAGLYAWTLQQARETALEPIVLPKHGPPPLYQWPVPIALLGAFWGVGYL